MDVSGSLDGFYRLADGRGFVKQTVEGGHSWDRVDQGTGSAVLRTPVSSLDASSETLRIEVKVKAAMPLRKDTALDSEVIRQLPIGSVVEILPSSRTVVTNGFRSIMRVQLFDKSGWLTW